jgi:pimeloyl-ACP methyl ester carboxylesterase
MGFRKLREGDRLTAEVAQAKQKTGGVMSDQAAAAATVPRPLQHYTEPDWIEVEGLRVAYRRKGSGEATLYMHGAGLTRMWLPFYERLAGSLDLIVPEHPGYGATEMPEWLDGFDDLVIHYDALIEALGLDRVHLVGYSLGGWIAAELAVFYPRRFASLTLVTPIGLRVSGKPLADIFAMTPEDMGALFFNDPTNMAEVLPDLESLEEVEHQFGEAATLARLAWNPRFDPKLERRLARVSCPSLVVRAEHDRVVPDAIAERYAELLPDARLETVPGTGHALIVEQPDRTSDVVADFIRDHAASRAQEATR